MCKRIKGKRKKSRKMKSRLQLYKGEGGAEGQQNFLRTHESS